MVADPASTSDADLDAWLAEIDVYVLVDTFVGSLAARVPGVRERADRWSASSRDWTAQAGWDLYTQLALRDGSLDDGDLRALLERIERSIDIRYVGQIQEGIAGSGATGAGSPASYYYYWDGAPINDGPGPWLPSDEVDHLLYPCTVDGSRAVRELGWAPSRTLRETIRAVLEPRGGEPR